MSRDGGLGSRRTRKAIWIAAAVATVLALGPSSASAQSAAVYSLAGGCYTLTSATAQAAPGAAQLRLQATDLGSFLLYRTDQQFLAATGSSVAPVPQPSPAADWVVDDAPDSTFTLSPESDAPEREVTGADLRAGPPRLVLQHRAVGHPLDIPVGI